MTTPINSDVLRKAIRSFHELLKQATTQGLLDELAGDVHPDRINLMCDSVAFVSEAVGLPEEEAPLDEADQKLFDEQPEDAEGNRKGVGHIACKYCGSKECNFGCDESQAGGFGEGEDE